MKKVLVISFLYLTSIFVFAEKPSITDCWRVFKHSQIEKRAEYVGGEDEMFKFIYKNILWRCGNQSYQGRIMVTFIVDTNGKLWDVKVDTPIAKCLDDEIVKAVSSMPAWEPATLDGFPVCSEDTINLRIRLGFEENRARSSQY